MSGAIDSSSLSGGSATTYSPRSSSNHVGSSSSCISSNSSSEVMCKSGVLITNTKPHNMELKSGSSTDQNNIAANTNVSNGTRSSFPSHVDDGGLSNSNVNSPQYENENSQVHSMPIYPKSSPIHDHSEDLFHNQDGSQHVPITYATSTPFTNAKKQAHFSSLQLSTEVSSVTQSNISESDSANQAQLILPPSEIAEEKSHFDSPFLDTDKNKIDTNFSCLPLSAKSTGGKCSSISIDSSNLTKPVLLDSPDHNEVIEKKLKFDSPASVDKVSGKTSETLDVPMWCKDYKEIHNDNSITEHVKEPVEFNIILSEVSSEKCHGDRVTSDPLGETNNLKESTSYKELNEESSADVCMPPGNSTFTNNSVPDIFNPVISQVTQSPTSPRRSQQHNTPGSFDENLPSMNFELTPDTEVTGNVECFRPFQGKVDFTKEEIEAPPKHTFTKIMEGDSGNSQVTSIFSGMKNKEWNMSYSEFSKYDASEEGCVFQVGMPVFALWNKIYYPGVVMNIDDSTTLTIHFHDDQVVTMPKRNAFLHNLLTTHGQQCKVKMTDEYYDDALIMAAYKYNNEIYYTVLIHNDHRVIDRNSICFSQIQRQKLCTNSKDIISHKRRTEPVLSSSGSENYFIAKTPTKKLKHNHRLFEGITIYIIPDDSPVLCSSIVMSSIEEEAAVEDFPFDIVNLKKIIEDNGGVVIPKLHGRDMPRASKLICIATSCSASLQFLYAVVVGIPVLHYDWIHRSIEAKCLKPYEKGEYVLPAGRDIFGDTVEQNITKRGPYTPLNLLRFYVHTDGEIKNHNRLLDMILYKCGCERLFSSMYVTDKTKKLPFNIDTIDFVLTMVDHVPIPLVHAAHQANKSIVTATWFVQCLINNQLIDMMDCPIFRYTEPELKDMSTSNENLNSKELGALDSI